MRISPLLLLATLASFLPVSRSAAAAAPAPAPGERMNVLFLIADDMRAELGSYSGRAQTPNLDRLAKQGVVFPRAYCQYPLCNPSRTSMLTGRHTTTTNVYGNRDWFRVTHPEWPSIPSYFRDQGYLTLRTGKIFHGGMDDFTAWTQGGEPHRYGEQKSLANTPRATLSDTDEKQRVAQMVASDVKRAPESDRWEAVEGEAPEKLGDTVVADRAIAYLREYNQKGGQPFFLACGFSKPHSPLVAPKRFFDLYRTEDIALPVDFAPLPTVPAGFPVGSIRPINADLFVRRAATPDEARAMIRAYLACISYVDWNAGRVLAELDALGLRERTIVVFWSDHGYQLGEKGKWSKAGSLWENGTRVPFIIHDPRAKGNGTSSPRVVQAVDIFPTLVELTGLPRPAGIEGRSLSPLLQTPDQDWNHPAFTVWNERNRGITGAVVRTERWRYAEFFGRGAGAMLTDPVNDPAETKNLVTDPQYADIVKELSAKLRAYVADKTELPAQP
ncbi:sulfatase [Opitutus sp. ER46]|uniref:sulfatase n=1 Tax=Opitutus sp. ER46 TaxID=2161864 RepID=UPI000D2FFA42|nr:sulfatase [Opitutus sp. ER46]PTX99024.1 sulfatase [Opitutus sp. ER46]